MSFEFVDIDHAMIRVAQLSEAIETFRSFGFTVAPARTHGDSSEPSPETTRQKPSSDASRCILFQPHPGRDDIANFVVLQCIPDQLNMPVKIAQMLSFMLDTEGPKALVCYSKDLERTGQAMSDAGIEVGPPGWVVDEFWEDGDRKLPVHSQPLIPETRRTPFVVSGFHTRTLESFRHIPWTVHENTARYMAGLTGVTDDIQRDVATMAEQVFGVDAEWVSDDIAIVRPRDLFLRIVTPGGFDALYPGLDFSTERILPALSGVTFAVASMERLRSTLDANGVEHVETADGTVVVPRQKAANTMLEFVPAS